MNFARYRLVAVALWAATALQAAPTWYDGFRVRGAAQDLVDAVTDFNTRLQGVPGTTELRRVGQSLHASVSRFRRLVQSGADANTVVAEGQALAPAVQNLQLTLRQFQVQESTSYFLNDFFRVLDANNRLQFWLTPVTGGPGPIPGTSPKPVELKDTFTVSTGYMNPSQSDFDQAGNTARAACVAWKEQISQSTAGRVSLSQCSGAARVTGSDGKVAAEVNGSVSLDFQNLKSLEEPQGVSFPVLFSTGYMNPAQSDLDQAANAALAECKSSLQESRRVSKGTFLYAYCGGAKRVTAYDGKIGMSVAVVASVSWPKNGNAPQTVNQAFQVTTGYMAPAQSDINQAAASALAQCRRWATDIIAGSAAQPMLVTCAGPEVVKPNKVDVVYRGTAVMVLP